MKITLKPEHDITEEACLASTGKTLSHWIEAIQSDASLAHSRRDATSWLYAEMNKDPWWPTTVWVEYEARNGIVKKDGRPEGYNICSTKTISAPLTNVFQAFAETGLTGWMAQSITPDGDGFEDESANTWTLTRIREGKDIRWTWRTAGSEHPSEVEVLFSDKAGKTSVIINHNRIQTRAEADGLRAAWALALAQLKTNLETKP